MYKTRIYAQEVGQILNEAGDYETLYVEADDITTAGIYCDTNDEDVFFTQLCDYLEKQGYNCDQAKIRETYLED